MVWFSFLVSNWASLIVLGENKKVLVWIGFLSEKINENQTKLGISLKIRC